MVGCLEKIETYVEKNTKLLGGIAVAVIIVMVRIYKCLVLPMLNFVLFSVPQHDLCLRHVHHGALRISDVGVLFICLCNLL